MGVSAPLGPHLSSSLSGLGQGGNAVCCSRGRRYRCRRCLLKGCERWFRPLRPQARYCSVGCQAAARRWRRWLASRGYRQREQGRQRRRDQSQRYRARVRERRQRVAAQLTSSAATAADEGQRPASQPKIASGVPCHRPGCYVVFVVASRSPQQKFCSCSCHKALRRVQQREACYRARRRRLARRRAVTGRAPPGGLA